MAALVPTPRAHLARYHGVPAPAAKWRPSVVTALAVAPTPVEADGVPRATREASTPGETLDPKIEGKTLPPPRNYAWAELLRRVFEIDVLACECGGRLRIIADIHPPDTTRKILDCLGLPSRATLSAASIRNLSSEWL